MRQLKITQSTTYKDSQSLDRYLNEINKVRLLTNEQELDLAIRVKQGDLKAKEMLCKANLRFVVSVAKQYQNMGLSLPDLISEGNIGLMKAVERFDHTRGFRFISYAVWWIRQQILQSIAEDSAMLRIPMNRILANNQIKRFTSEFEQLNGRVPTNEELAEKFETTPARIKGIMIDNLRTLSLDQPVSEVETLTLVDFLPNETNPAPDQLLIHEGVRMQIERGLSELRGREAEILRLSFGLSGGRQHTLEEIGEKFDLTRERVRQIREEALRKLRRSEELAMITM